jgi:hypothetical protein
MLSPYPLDENFVAIHDTVGLDAVALLDATRATLCIITLLQNIMDCSLLQEKK